jgi:hypothetical protein
MQSSLSLTKYWLENIVIGLNLCPFAKIPYQQGLVRIVECEDSDEEVQMMTFLKELDFLNESASPALSTTLIVYPNGNADFFSFNDFVGEIELMLEKASLDKNFQLVGFHPKFVFTETDFNHLGNLVNRSPFPILQILRTEEMAKAVKNPKDGEIISLSNDKMLNELSQEAIDQLFYYLKK